MKKRFAYPALLVLFLSVTAFVVLRYNGRLRNEYVAFYPLKARKGAAAGSAEYTTVKEQANGLIRIVRETPGDKKSALALATLYVQEGRATGDFEYYDEAALHYVEDVLKTEPANFEALMLKSLVQLSQHHFDEGLQTAQRAKEVNPYNAYVYGLITDGNVEMGHYKAAVESADKMVSIRPDLRSYSRIAYLREIHGDMPGAIEAMNEAVKAGFPGEEGTEWARIQLARLYEATGDLKSAEMHYTIALRERPGYAHGVAGLGSIAVANREYAKAIALYKGADTLQKDYAFKEGLAEAYLLNGQPKEADAVLDAIVKELTAAANKGEAAMNHHADNELAYVYLVKKEYGKALQHAEAEYRRRPKNMDVNETLAWVLYKSGNPKKALPFITVATQTGSKVPTLLCRAGLIYLANGDAAKAKELVQQGLKNSPHIDASLRQECSAVLQTL